MGAKKKKKKVLCHDCIGWCCRYMAVPVDTPVDRDDFDDIRWYLIHKGVSAFVDKKDWYINVENKCKYLSARDHRCKIYDKRPKVCRDHKITDCEHTSDEYDYELYFANDKQMEEYIKIKFDNNKQSHPCNGKNKLKKRVYTKK